MVLLVTLTTLGWVVVVTFVIAMCRAAASADDAPSAAGPLGKELERPPVGEIDGRSGQRGGPPPSSKRGLRGARAFLSRCLRAPAAQPH